MSIWMFSRNNLERVKHRKWKQHQRLDDERRVRQRNASVFVNNRSMHRRVFQRRIEPMSTIKWTRATTSNSRQGNVRPAVAAVSHLRARRRGRFSLEDVLVVTGDDSSRATNEEEIDRPVKIALSSHLVRSIFDESSFDVSSRFRISAPVRSRRWVN